MTQEEIRLECLKLAVNQYQFSSLNEPPHDGRRSIKELYDAYFDLVTNNKLSGTFNVKGSDLVYVVSGKKNK